MPADQELPKNDDAVKSQPAAAELENTNEELKDEDAEKVAGGGLYGKIA